MDNYFRLWVELTEFFKTTKKTGWGKNEVLAKLVEMELAAARGNEEGYNERTKT